MDHDIPKAIESNSNYLAALGLSTYTEILGGFRYGDLKTGREANVAGSQRYLDFVINYFDNREYERINLQLKEAGLKGLYGVVRSGLIHEYFIKKRSQIVIENKPSSICGISYNPKNDPAIIFYVKKYFEDFKHAFEKYRNQLQGDNSEELLKKFENALKSIDSDLIGLLDKSDLYSAMSGGMNYTIKRSKIDLDNTSS